jgi:hypothetical protein
MIVTSCLLLKPQVTEAEKQNQKQNIDIFIKPAIVQAGLTVFDGELDGLEVNDISEELVQKVYETHILIVDANRYDDAGFFQFSPYLYYFIALGHSIGNRTILVAESGNAKLYLPISFIKYHTILYTSETECPKFIDRFKAAVDEIRQERNSRPDNPVQDYLIQKTLEETRKEILSMKAEIEALKAHQRNSNMHDQQSSPIVFRKLNPAGK